LHSQALDRPFASPPHHISKKHPPVVKLLKFSHDRFSANGLVNGNSLEVVMSEQVQVRQRGTLTIPASLREKYGIRAGDTFQLVDLDGVFVLTPMVPMVPELAREIERVRREEGLTVDELLQGLREQRTRYHLEREARDEAE
jgi:AbrB family looped-hinge helix DNA binding protein